MLQVFHRLVRKPQSKNIVKVYFLTNGNSKLELFFHKRKSKFNGSLYETTNVQDIQNTINLYISAGIRTSSEKLNCFHAVEQEQVRYENEDGKVIERKKSMLPLNFQEQRDGRDYELKGELDTETMVNCVFAILISGKFADISELVDMFGSNVVKRSIQKAKQNGIDTKQFNIIA